MSEKKVDLKPIENLYLEHLISVDEDTKQPIDDMAIKVVGHQMVAKVFEGTDVFLTEDGQLQMIVQGADGKPETIKRPLHKEVAWLWMIRNADANKDHQLDTDEVRKMFQENFSKAEYDQMDPEAFLNGVEETINKRWAKIAVNMLKFDGDLNWKPTLDALDTYNDGIYIDEMRHSQSVFPLNGLSKTAVNLVGFIPHNLGGKYLWGGKGSSMPGDALAESGANGRYADRKAAMAALRAVIEEGIKNNEDWALQGNLDEAMKKLGSGHREILTDDIPAKRIHGILTMPDDKKRAEALYSFALGERPSILGLAGGNTGGFWNFSNSSRSWDNYAGWHRNSHFARSALAFLGNKQQVPGDPIFNESMRKQAVETRKDILGDTGSFTNMVSWGTTHVWCGAGYVLSAGNRLFETCEPTPWRSWGDEARMDMVGRTIDFGLIMFSTYKGFQYLKEAWAFRRMAGMRGVVSATKEGFSLRATWFPGRLKGKGFSPIPAKAMKEAKDKFAAKLTSDGEAIPKGWLGRGWSKFWGKVLGPVKERVSDKTAKRFSGAAHTGGKFIAGLTDYVIIPLAVAKPVDERFQAYYNPFDTNHELELAPYPDVTKPDPATVSK